MHLMYSRAVLNNWRCSHLDPLSSPTPPLCREVAETAVTEDAAAVAGDAAFVNYGDEKLFSRYKEGSRGAAAAAVEQQAAIRLDGCTHLPLCFIILSLCIFVCLSVFVFLCLCD